MKKFLAILVLHVIAAFDYLSFLHLREFSITPPYDCLCLFHIFQKYLYVCLGCTFPRGDISQGSLAHNFFDTLNLFRSLPGSPPRFRSAWLMKPSNRTPLSLQFQSTRSKMGFSLKSFAMAWNKSIEPFSILIWIY